MKKWRLPLIAGICVSLLGIVCLLVFFLGGQDAELQESASRAPKDSKPSAVKKDSAVKRDPIAKQDTVVKRDPPVKKDAVVKRDQAVKKEAVVKRDRPLATVAGPRLTNTLGMQFVQIPAGKFRMGSLASEMGHKEEEEPAHEVSISKPFFMGVHPVTIGNFRDFVRATGYKTEAEQGQGAYRWNSTNREEELDPKCSWQAPGWSQANDHPVVCVSWNDAQAFCRWLSKKEGRAYRLPSEAEYEYACRAGSQTSYSFGDDPAALGRHAWYAENAAGQAHPVGQLQPNAWGLYDIQGNVWTWCTDFYDSDYYHSSPAQDPPGAAGGDMRSVRGGSWNFPASCCRAAFRDSYSQGKPGNHIGFRVVFPAAP